MPNATSFAPARVRLLALTLAFAASCTPDSANADLSEKLRNFDKHALVWLGESYDADGDDSPDPIRSAREQLSPAFYHPITGEILHGEFRIFSISYGDCSPKPCALPLNLTFYAPCEDSVPLSDIVKAGETKVRGVNAIVKTDGGLWIETADFTLQISALGATPEEVTKNAKKIANDLIPGNEKAKHLTKGTDFKIKPKDFCEKQKTNDVPSPTPSPLPLAVTPEATLTPEPTP